MTLRCGRQGHPNRTPHSHVHRGTYPRPIAGSGTLMRLEMMLEDSIELVRDLGRHGLDLVDISMGGNTDQAKVPYGERGFMIPAAARIRAETGVPTAASWNLADPAYADEVIRDGQIGLLMIGRPTLANPHWPYYAAMVLGENAPLDLMPEQYRYFLAKAQGVKHACGFGGIQ
jgi:2,4-dienoyl-CoA reductase-like NADH-dependent reductase (Old Yellow Enzyme family)